MSNNGVGAGISFNGPIQLSGLALSKKYLLETMDNYMQFMSGMLNLFGEDIEVFSTAARNQASGEKKFYDEASTQELVTGLSSGLTAGLTIGVSLGVHYSGKKFSKQADDSGSRATNLESIQDELHTSMQDPTSTSSGGVRAGTAPQPSTSDVNEVIERLKNPTTANGGADYYTKFEQHGTTSSDALQERQTAKEAFKELERRRTQGTPQEKMQAERDLNRIRDNFRDKIKYARIDKEFAGNKLNQHTARQQTIIPLLSQASQATTGVTKAQLVKEQADAKVVSTYGQSNVQLNQQTLNSTDGAAQKAAKNAEDLVQLERQIQANNITRG